VTAPGVFTTTAAGGWLQPNGHAFHGYGVAQWDNTLFGRQTDVITGGATLATRIRSQFPRINLFRIACYNFTSLGYRTGTIYDAFVNSMTSNGVACVIESHNTAHATLTGTALTNETNWYAYWAGHYVSNPLVMFQTMNEPGTNAGWCAQMLATYNAVRGAGNTSTFFCEANAGGGYANGTNYAAIFDDPTVFQQMHNVAFDQHYYSPGSATNTLQWCTDYVNQAITSLQTVQSATGIIPVTSLEFGNSVNGSTIDTIGNNLVQAVFNASNTVGATVWSYNSANTASLADNLTTDTTGTTLNSFGTFCATQIASSPGAVPY